MKAVAIAWRRLFPKLSAIMGFEMSGLSTPGRGCGYRVDRF